jgi:hypothetical protein
VSTGAPEGKSLPVPAFKFYTKYLKKKIFSLSIEWKLTFLSGLKGIQKLKLSNSSTMLFRLLHKRCGSV